MVDMVVGMMEECQGSGFSVFAMIVSQPCGVETDHHLQPCRGCAIGKMGSGRIG
jgi:hypothetical protein